MQGLRPAAAAAAVEVEAPKVVAGLRPRARDAGGHHHHTPTRLSRMDDPRETVTGQMIVADGGGETFLIGSVARQTLPQGVPIARSATVQPGDRGFLAAVLPKGKRAITIPVTEIAGLNGLALPGDWVDLILTYIGHLRGRHRRRRQRRLEAARHPRERDRRPQHPGARPRQPGRTPDAQGREGQARSPRRRRRARPSRSRRGRPSRSRSARPSAAFRWRSTRCATAGRRRTATPSGPRPSRRSG